MGEDGHSVGGRTALVADVDGGQQVGQLLGRALDHPAGRLARRGELRPTLEALDLEAADLGHPLAAAGSLDQHAAREPDRGEEHRRQHVVPALDGERPIRHREEEVERQGGGDTRDDPDQPATAHRGRQNDEDQDECEVGAARVPSERDERGRRSDGDERRQREAQGPSSMLGRLGSPDARMTPPEAGWSPMRPFSPDERA